MAAGSQCCSIPYTKPTGYNNILSVRFITSLSNIYIYEVCININQTEIVRIITNYGSVTTNYSKVVVVFTSYTL